MYVCISFMNVCIYDCYECMCILHVFVCMLFVCMYVMKGCERMYVMNVCVFFHARPSLIFEDIPHACHGL